MSGNDFRFLIIDPALKQARRLLCRKGLIALAACVLVVLPMCWAHSRSGATDPISPSGNSVGWALPTDSVLPVWSELPGMSVDRSPDVTRRADSEPSVESFTVYPGPATSPASPSIMGKQQLVEEIERRLARMTAGVTATAAEPPNPVSRPTAMVSQPVASSASPGLDANAPLQLFQPAGWASPINSPSPAKVIAPAIVPEPATESRRDPNLNSNPAAQAAFTRHFESAKAFQQQGQSARAAEAFTLALAYRPNDANACLGKGLALFAAGQYAGSGSALARAVDLDSRVALKKADLIRIAGGPDEFIARFNDLARHAEANPTPEQHFLLAYIYYQMDQFQQARTSVEAAQKASYSPVSVQAMITAIDRQGRN
jgi:hypothetical protein